MEEKVIMRELHAKKDEKLLFDIVEHENKVFGDASIGNWNVKPFAKYGKIYATLIQDENQNEKIVSVVEVLSSFNRDKAYIYGVFTVPEFQGKKYATKLLKFVLENLEKLGIKNNEVALILADKYKVVHDGLGALRLKLGEELELIDKNAFKFLWVVDFPMFEWSEEENRYKAQHHPFTSIKEEGRKYLDTNELAKIKTDSYDIVLNGYEIGGGSIRIHDEDLQAKVFEKLGFSQEELEDKFGFFLEVLKYGVPPHGGLAYGIDRWLMAMLKEDSIKEVIPFPKTNKGQDLMTGAPAGIEEQVLEDDLRLKLLEVEKED